MSGDHREVPTGALQGAQPPASCFPRAPGMAGWLTRDAAPTPLPPAHNCPQTLHAHSDARTAQGLQGTRPIFMSKLVFLGGGGRGGRGQQGNLGPHRPGSWDGPGLCLWTSWLRPSMVLHSMDSVWPHPETPSLGEFQVRSRLESGGQGKGPFWPRGTPARGLVPLLRERSDPLVLQFHQVLQPGHLHLQNLQEHTPEGLVSTLLWWAASAPG